MGEANFTKLFSSITDSTIWSESAETRIVWITMLAMSDKNGWVYASVPGLAHRAHVSIKETEEALKKFLSPDRYSRTPDHEGRRIEEIEGGWSLLNHPKYRAIRSEEERRAYQRIWISAKRKAKKEATIVDSVVDNVEQCLPQSTNTDTDTDKKENIVEQKPDDVEKIFVFWKETFNHPKAAIDKKRKTLIKNALKLYSFEDCKKAITGCSRTPHNIGDNDRKQVYDGIHIIFKDADQIDRFIGNSKPNKSTYAGGIT